MPEIHVSVIVPTYNGEKRLPACLAALGAQDLPADCWEIIVVDNASSDNTPEVVKKFAENIPIQVKYVYEKCLGLHNARHAGVREAKGVIVAFVDDDIICEPSWLREILYSYNDGRIGCVGGRVLPKWEIPPPKWILRYPGALALLDLGDQPKQLRWPDTVYGCNFSIRRDLLFRLGGFNPESFGPLWLGDGETGLQRKLYRAGWGILYNPRAVVWHVIPSERITLDYMSRRFANQGACKAYSLLTSPLAAKVGARSLATVLFLLTGVAALWHRPLMLLPGSYSYHHRLRYTYLKSISAYVLRYLRDSKLRALVQNGDWINTLAGSQETV